MADEIMTISQANVELVSSSVPQAYRENQVSHDRCIEFGQKILDAIRAQGMTDELDRQAADFIGRARKTVAKMNEKRSPATKLFDQFRKVFTTMENDVDVTKAGSVPYQLQELRNQYAVRRREEEERRRVEEARRQQAEQARRQYRSDCEAEFLDAFNSLVNREINRMTAIFSGITLESLADAERRIRDYSTELPEDWDKGLASVVRLPLNVDRQELQSIRGEVRGALMANRFREEYRMNIENTRDEFVQMLPSKKKELERIAAQAQANAAEAARLEAEMKAKEEAEARRREEERAAKEESEHKAAEAKKTAEEMGGLFEAAAADVQTYTPKTSVKKRINLLNAEGILSIFGKWWADVGSAMAPDELAKMFKKQITYCEGLANSPSPVFVEDESVEYVDEVKAK